MEWVRSHLLHPDLLIVIFQPVVLQHHQCLRETQELSQAQRTQRTTHMQLLNAKDICTHLIVRLSGHDKVLVLVVAASLLVW